MFGFFKKKQEPETRSLSIDEVMATMGATNTGAGEFVSPHTAEALPAVLNAVNVIAQAVASMPCYLFEVTTDGRKRIENHSVEYLLNEMPNRNQTPYQLKEVMMRHLLLNGNAYAVIGWNSKGQPETLTPFPPYAVNVQRTLKGDYLYQITDLNGKVNNYFQDEILHLRHASNDGFMGRSPITVCREAVGLGLAQQRHGSAVMKNGLMAGGIVTTSEWLDQTKGQKALEALKRYQGAKNAGKTPLLEGGMDYKQLGMSNQDAEWLGSRKFTIEDIARIFNISPIFLQDYSHSSYANFSEASRAFLGQTLRPHLVNFEQQLKDALMIDLTSKSRKRYVIEFDTSDLLRTNQQERFASYDTAIKCGILSPNEARKREGLLPYVGGDEFSQAWKQTVEVKKGGEDGKNG
ncbi:phage portal protein [Glaesserella parasuis]|uniref:Portal protein (GP3) n=1 Tax=Glaesserella parasuis ZJ0906 TaxID=1322346 RepID=A0A806JB11_GLAPU|nr:phage portal protein [Glaesserella parasuis]AGO16836.1 Portal protein (GP3) [Glaesserella parasuis ZJ0906]AIK90086.1 HK97 family phage portal protein [Glaesserella parasuis]MDD2163544.1 phage portal protein [Glaesserella parasuis]MDG6237085.1 phage portal protein [Glaesserella parasuis]MDG6264989.1 phage portal protein [Glaesserella parasuis]